MIDTIATRARAHGLTAVVTGSSVWLDLGEWVRVRTMRELLMVLGY